MHSPESQLPARALSSRNCEGLVPGERSWYGASGFALAIAAVFATRVPYLPSFLEDLDSVNFDLGVHDFNPFLHQPHPPGFPVFIAMGKAAHAFVDNHATALALVSALCSALAIIPLWMLARRTVGAPALMGATLLLTFNPLVWLSSVRPMSDIAGFAAVVTAQTVLLRAHRDLMDHRRGHRWLIFGVILAGMAMGIRIQNVILLLPFILVIVAPRPGLWGVASAGLAVALASWIVPTILESGGVHRLWARLRLMLAVAWPSEPLASRPSWSGARGSLADVFVLPWGEPWIALPILLLAAIGCRMMWRERRAQLSALLILLAPYAAYHLLFQETATLRYSIPVLPLVVLPAAYALASVRFLRAAPLAITVLLAVVTLPKLSAYSQTPSPPFQAIASLDELPPGDRPIVSGDHVFERYLPLARPSRIIRPRPLQEWHGLNRYWVAGGRGPVWYFRDPARSVLQLSDASAQQRIDTFQWPIALRAIFKGMRPLEVELVRLTPPRWFAESGFLLAPDAGSPDRVASEPHLFFVSSTLKSDRVLISGTSPQPTDITIVAEGQRQKWSVSQHFTVQATVRGGHVRGDAYIPIRLEASTPLQLTTIAIADEGQDVLEPVHGLYPPERDDTRREFRWVAPDAGILVSRSGAPLTLTLRGRVPADHVKLPLRLKARVDDDVREDYLVNESDFAITMHLDATTRRSSIVRLSSSHSFVPDVVERNGDTRRLAFRMYSFDLRRAAPR